MIDETDTGFHPSANGTEHTLVQGMGILFGSATHTSLKEVLVAYLPPRQQLDRYVSAYFKAPSLVASFLHTPHFQRHYQTFWTDPLSSPPLWISILFSICHIAKNALRVGKQDDTRDDTFSVAAGHCLVIGEYFRPKRFALEALLIHTQSQCLSTKSLSPDVAPLCGIMAQTASMMGYHRNPDTLGLTPFEAEMRRRVWSMFVQLDLLISFHLGIPSSIQAPIDAVSPPRNLNNSDFNEDMAEIPPSRPLVESTEIQFCIAKHGFMAVLDKILRHALQSQQDQDSLGQINILDAEIRNTSSALPDALKWRPMTESVFDTPNMIVTRLCVLFIDCKSRCVLHRPYVLQRRPESIRACYDAASMLLRGFCDAYYEFTPEGQAKTDGWFIASLTWHDFLMGAVSLCLSSMIGKQSLVEPVIDVEEVISLLSQGAAICGSQGTGRGPETRRVRKIIDATIHRLRQYEAAHVPGSKNLMVDLGESNQIGRNGGPPLPMPMDDALWDEHLGHYLHLDFSGQDTMPGVDHGIL